MRRASPEFQLHEQVADYLSVALKPPAWWSTFPAGGGGAIRGAMLKRVGLKTGVPDILIIVRGKAFWIELKSHRGTLSPEQLLAHPILVTAGCPVATCRTLAEVQLALEGWGVPTREVKPVRPAAHCERRGSVGE
jgi:hypothetical protein